MEALSSHHLTLRTGLHSVSRRLREDSLEKPPGEGNSQNRQILSKIEPERAPEMMPKHRKSLPNGRQQEPQRGRREAPPCLGRRRLVVFHLVRISFVLASFPEPVLGEFPTKFADSENSLPQGACLKSLPATSYYIEQQKNSLSG